MRRLLFHQLLPMLLIVALVVTGCASWTSSKTQADRTKALLAFGETLDASGNSFVGVGKIYNASLDAGLLTPEQYRKWAGFATQFKPAYEKAVQAWKLARTANNLNSMEAVQTQIGPMLAELASFGLSIYQLTTIPVAK